MTHEVIAQLKKAYYAGYEECEKGDANCFTGWREWASQLQSTQEGGTVEAEQFWQSKNGGKPSELALSHGEYISPVYVVRLLTEYASQVSATDKKRISELEKACEEYSKEGRKMAEDADAKVAELEKDVEMLRGLVEDAYSSAYNRGYMDCRDKVTNNRNPFEQFKQDHNL